MKVKYQKLSKRFLAIILAVVISTSLSICVFAADREITDEGTIGEVSWTLYQDGELHIYGDGNLATASGYLPWYRNADKITKITIGKDVKTKTPSGYTFAKRNTTYKNLAEIIVEDGNEFFITDEKGALFTSDKKTLILFPALNTTSEYTVPDTVTKIDKAAFSFCGNLKNITFPDGLKTIEEAAFYNSGIENAIIPDGVSSLGTYCFSGAKELKTVVLPKKIRAVTISVFAGCISLEKIDIPQNIECISDSAFANSGLTEIIIPETVTEVKKEAFGNCKKLQNAVVCAELIEKGAFNNCVELKTITLKSLKTLENEVFSGCAKLKTVYLPETVAEISYAVFAGCTDLEKIEVEAANTSFSSENGVLFNKDKSKLIAYPAGKTDEVYVIPEKTKIIDVYAFYMAKYLKDVVIPNDIEYIGEYAFLNTKQIYDNPAKWDHINGFLYIGSNLIATDAKKIKNECELYPDTTLIATGAFISNENITSVKIPDTVKHINKAAFSGCTNLESINLSENLQSIGEFAFYNCQKLSYVHIPSGVKEISRWAFKSCYLLQPELEEGLEKIGEEAFGYLKNITEIEIPGTVNSLNTTAFEGSAITDVYYGSEMADWKIAVGGEIIDGITVHYTLKTEDGSVVINHTDDSFAWYSGNVFLLAKELDKATPSFDRGGFYVANGHRPIQVHDIVISSDRSGDNPIQPVEGEHITVKIKVNDSFAALMKAEIESTGKYTNVDATEIDYKNGILEFECEGKRVQFTPSDKFLGLFSVYHWFSDGTTAKDCEIIRYDKFEVKNGYIILETNHFSDFAICVSSVDFDKSEIEIENGKSQALNLVNANDKTITFKSTDETVATVDENGVVTAKKPGEATIIATAEGSGLAAECKVTVLPREFTLTWNIDGEKTEVKVGEGEIIPEPEKPVKDGYSFKGWEPDVPETMPSRDLEISAVFEKITVKKLRLNSKPAKLAYAYKIDSLDLNGIEIIAEMTDGSTENVDVDDVTVSGFDSLRTGTQTITVEYEGKTVQFEVTVARTWWQWLITIFLLGFLWY